MKKLSWSHPNQVVYAARSLLIPEMLGDRADRCKAPAEIELAVIR